MPKMHHCLNPQNINTNYSLSPFFSHAFLSHYHLSFSFKPHLTTLITQTPNLVLFSVVFCLSLLFDKSLLSQLREVLSLSSLCSIEYYEWGVNRNQIINLDQLATSTREKRSALVLSCYVPSRTTCSDDIINKSNTKVEDGRLGFRGGGGRRRRQHQPPKRHGGRSCTAVSSEPCRLKSNLKIKTEAEKGVDQRKVSWPDAHGKDIAHVQEFELSASEDGEHAGYSKRKYCGVCIIQ